MFFLNTMKEYSHIAKLKPFYFLNIVKEYSHIARLKPFYFPLSEWLDGPGTNSDPSLSKPSTSAFQQLTAQPQKEPFGFLESSYVCSLA